MPFFYFIIRAKFTLMRFFLITSAIILSVFLFVGINSCKLENPYKKHIKELDSLKIVLDEAILYFSQTDSVMCQQKLKTQQVYSTFITERLKDTVTITEAESIQLFLSLGKPLSQFITYRNKWLNAAKQTSSQLKNLSTDLKNNALEPTEVVEFVGKEKFQAEKTIQELKINSQLIRENLEKYDKTLLTNERIIKKINKGILPTIPQ